MSANGDGTEATRQVERRARARVSQEPARRIGHFRIEGELGRGGMGVVYRGFDEKLHRPVALKSLPDDLAGDAEQLARLEREARTLALVSHPNVATIHGMESAAGATYLVLELVEGETLRARLDRGALPFEESVALCGQVAAGLEAVHRKGLVHRDLKASNVMVTIDGIAKLLDFGLARQSRGELGELTRRGEIVGTSGWMSPEQLRGEEVDARSDAWSWGCLLYECLAGSAAFPGATWADRDAATLAKEPDWERLPESVADELRELLEQCFAKDRNLRPASLTEVGRRLSVDGTLSSRTRRLPGHSLPAERDAFVGRAAELATLEAMLEGGARLVSVLGIGGTGKTRLVLRHARERLGAWPGGAWFCDLSEARGVDGITHAVARALDVPLGKDDPVVQLGHAIAGRGRCLVILDNFEQVARHADETLGRWLDRASEAQFLVTTREVLGLQGETSLALAPLRQDEAVELFVARAIQAKRDFVLTDADRPHVEALARLLDALPLAIELAAARVRVMPPTLLHQRMSERFKLLTSSGGRHTRQATLRATLDWSWELLAPDEQQGLAQLSVFEGGFTLESAEAVLSLSQAWPADAVQSLMDKSLIRRVSDERFDLLVSVQEYAAEKLEARGGRSEAEARHGTYFARLGTDEAIATLEGHDGTRRRHALTQDLENLLAACRRAAARGDGEVAAPCLVVAWTVLAMTGPVAAGLEVGEAVARLPGLTAQQRAGALRVLGDASRLMGRMDEAGRHFEQALEIHREIDGRRFHGLVLSDLGNLRREQGRMEEARAFLEQALAITREVGGRTLEAIVLGNLGNLHHVHGRMNEARSLYEQALAITREIGGRHRESIVLGNLGIVHYDQGRMDEARTLFEQSLAITREVGNRRSEGINLGNLGNLHDQQGRVDEACVLYEQALAIHRAVGDRRFEGNVLGNLGGLRAGRGLVDEARALYEQALAIHREVGHRRFEGEVLGNMGTLHRDQSLMDAARTFYEQALIVHRDIGNKRAEGVVLGDLSILHAREGRFDDARLALERGEALLREVDDRVELAHLLCCRAECERLAGQWAAARRAIAEAEVLATAAAAGPDSQLARAIAAARQAVDARAPG